jgi:altronate dehydratase small subunit
MSLGFQLNPRDNVATLLNDAAGGNIEVLINGERRTVPLLEPVKLGHKVALAELQTGDAVIKFGVPIGHATKPIARGAWVHLHNLASDLDARSGTLDLHSGAPTDTRYE